MYAALPLRWGQNIDHRNEQPSWIPSVYKITIKITNYSWSNIQLYVYTFVTRHDISGNNWFCVRARKAWLEDTLNKETCLPSQHRLPLPMYLIYQMRYFHISIFDSENNSTAPTLRDARMFSYLLTKKWAMHDQQCLAAVLILYSRYDGIVSFYWFLYRVCNCIRLSQRLLAYYYGQPPSTMGLSNISLGLYLDGWP